MTQVTTTRRPRWPSMPAEEGAGSINVRAWFKRNRASKASWIFAIKTLESMNDDGYVLKNPMETEILGLPPAIRKLEYRVVPFVANIGIGAGSDAAAAQLQNMIQQ